MPPDPLPEGPSAILAADPGGRAITEGCDPGGKLLCDDEGPTKGPPDDVELLMADAIGAAEVVGNR